MHWAHTRLNLQRHSYLCMPHLMLCSYERTHPMHNYKLNTCGPVVGVDTWCGEGTEV